MCRTILGEIDCSSHVNLYLPTAIFVMPTKLRVIYIELYVIRGSR